MVAVVRTRMPGRTVQGMVLSWDRRRGVRVGCQTLRQRLARLVIPQRDGWQVRHWLVRSSCVARLPRGGVTWCPGNARIRPVTRGKQMSNAQHWEGVYRGKRFDVVSWYAPHLRESLDLIERLCPDRTTAIIDVGGGESTLVDDLLVRRYTNLSVLDISRTAIDFTRARLGSRADAVSWHVGDITRFDFADHRYDVWHDRAVFHFLTAEADRRAYIEQVRRHVRKGGLVVMATFGPAGPLRCSDLDVVRYDAQRLHDEFGDHFRLIGSRISQHETPAHRHQEFLYCWCRVV